MSPWHHACSSVLNSEILCLKYPQTVPLFFILKPQFRSHFSVKPHWIPYIQLITQQGSIRACLLGSSTYSDRLLSMTFKALDNLALPSHAYFVSHKLLSRRPQPHCITSFVSSKTPLHPACALVVLSLCHTHPISILPILQGPVQMPFILRSLFYFPGPHSLLHSCHCNSLTLSSSKRIGSWLGSGISCWLSP